MKLIVEKMGSLSGNERMAYLEKKKKLVKLMEYYR